MNSARRILAAAAILVGTLAAPAFAAAKEGHHDREGDHHRVRHSIPEFDPASIGAIAAIVAGGGILIARRRSR